MTGRTIGYYDRADWQTATPTQDTINEDGRTYRNKAEMKSNKQSESSPNMNHTKYHRNNLNHTKFKRLKMKNDTTTSIQYHR